MVPVTVLKKLGVWTLYVHIVAQFNHRGLGTKVETNCLRDSELIPRHSFRSTTFSIFINRVLKFVCVFACSFVADKANLSSELSECKQSKSILKVMTPVMPCLRDIFHLKPKPGAYYFHTIGSCQNLLLFLSYCASFAHSIILKTFCFDSSTCVLRNTCKLCKV